MANSKYEYVKSYEEEDQVSVPRFIFIHIQARNFPRFSDAHQFDKPNDEKAVNLMNSCATAILEKFPDIIFGYGFRDEYSFLFTKESKFYGRRASKILSIIVSFFTSVYATRWKEYFPETKIIFPPSFQSRIIVCSSDALQAYLAWKQNECHTKYLYNTCFSLLVKHGKAEKEAEVFLKDTSKQDKHELLFQQFRVNYKELPAMFRQGSCVLKTKVEDIVKYNDDGLPIRRPRTKVKIVHSGNIASRSFWDEHLLLMEEVGSFQKDINKVKPEYIESFLFEKKLTVRSNWIVVRIDGRHFHKFSEVHEFEKPNDEQALNLMNLCAMAVMNEVQDITFSYGVSDEYSFVLKKKTQFLQRSTSGIVSAIVSLFSSVYTMNWEIFFPSKKLINPPCFDGRAVCYSTEEVRDYLAWRQVDCHINNQYNTCFWMLVKSGKSKKEAQDQLKGTQTKEKNELLAHSNIEYDKLPAIFRHGSSVFWSMVQKDETVQSCAQIDSPRKRKKEQEDETVESNDIFRRRLVVEHCNIIEDKFWSAHPAILLDELQ